VRAFGSRNSDFGFPSERAIDLYKAGLDSQDNSILPKREASRARCSGF
jgi:hypothetical protein